jgi:hypothetical protein
LDRGGTGIGAPPAHHQPFFPIDAKQPLVIYDEAFAAQQDVESAIAEAPPFLGERPQPFAQAHIVDPAGSTTDRHPHAADHPARPPFAHLVRLPQISDGLSLDSGRHHFFDSRSFSAALSSIESANSFFNRAFSPSSCFSRRASETSRPPNLLFQL